MKDTKDIKKRINDFTLTWFHYIDRYGYPGITVSGLIAECHAAGQTPAWTEEETHPILDEILVEADS